MDAKGEVTRVLIINKFGPYSNATTGQTARELADAMAKDHIVTSFLSIRAVYRGGQKVTGENRYHVTSIRNFYSGDQSFLRLISGMLNGFRLLMASFRIRKDIIIIMTEPPLLMLWFQLARRFIRAKVVYWTMDLYPEAFSAGDYIHSSSRIYRHVFRRVYKREPDFIIALGEQQLQYLQRHYPVSSPSAILPCGIVESVTLNECHDSGQRKIRFGYVGNLGAAHDANFLDTLIGHLDPEQHEICLSVYGLKSKKIRDKFKDHPAVRMKETMTYTDIASLDINVASLLPEWDHVCVPSKAVTAICCGTTLLLNASEHCDNWQMLASASWRISPAKDYSVSIRTFLGALTREEIDQRKMAARRLAKKLVEDRNIAFSEISKHMHYLHSDIKASTPPIA